MPVPAGIAVIAGLLIRPDLDGGKHAAHFDGAEWAVAAHHRQRVFRQRHLHRAHVCHALASHRHVIRDDAHDFLGDLALVDTDHRRYIVPHRIHRVVPLVAMECPVARLRRIELDGAHLPDGNVCRHFRPACCRRYPAAIGAGHFEFVAVQMDRMIGHAEIAATDAHAVALAADDGIDAGEDAAVPGPEVEVQHRVDTRRAAARLDIVGIEQEDEIAIDAILLRIFRMRDPETHHAHCHLRDFIGKLTVMFHGMDMERPPYV